MLDGAAAKKNVTNTYIHTRKRCKGGKNKRGTKCGGAAKQSYLILYIGRRQSEEQRTQKYRHKKKDWLSNIMIKNMRVPSLPACGRRKDFQTWLNDFPYKYRMVYTLGQHRNEMNSSVQFFLFRKLLDCAVNVCDMCVSTVCAVFFCVFIRILLYTRNIQPQPQYT